MAKGAEIHSISFHRLRRLHLPNPPLLNLLTRLAHCAKPLQASTHLLETRNDRSTTTPPPLPPKDKRLSPTLEEQTPSTLDLGAHLQDGARHPVVHLVLAHDPPRQHALHAVLNPHRRVGQTLRDTVTDARANEQSGVVPRPTIDHTPPVPGDDAVQERRRDTGPKQAGMHTHN